MMSNVPADLKYTKSHEWVRSRSDGTVEIGITDHAQHALGDLVFVDVPEAGRVVSAGEACAVVESVKAASDVLVPVDGEVVEVNGAIVNDPSIVNSDPQNTGWFFKLRLTDTASADALMDEAAYKKLVGQ